MKKRIKTTQGMSLIEVAIAVAITSLVVVGILGLYFQSVLLTKKMNQVLISTNLAASHLERLKKMDFAALALAEETDTRIDENGNLDSEGAFLRNTVVSLNYEGRTDLIQVEVSVDYELKGVFAGKPVTVTSVFAEP